jgi:hypothetical protein
MTTRTHIGPETHSDSTTLPAMDDLRGLEVRDIDGDKIGTVDDSYTDPQGTYLRYIAVKTGWFGTKHHMIPVDDVRLERDQDGDPFLVVPYDKDRLKSAPAFDRDEDFTYQRESDVYAHYGRTGYWEAVRARQTAPAPTPEIAEAEVADAIARGKDPHGVAVKRWGV